MFYKMVHNLTPTYMTELVPHSVSVNSQYSLRNASNIRSIRCNSQLYSNYFLPSVIQEWNKLPQDIRNSESISSFKRLLCINKSIIPHYHYTGFRKAQILHTQLRMNCSPLNLFLFQKNIIESPLCQCGELESTEHFFQSCSSYQNIRTELLNTIRPISATTTKILLNGNPNLPPETNSSIFEAVQKIIIKSKRFNR